MTFYTIRPLVAWTEKSTPPHKRRSRYTFRASWPNTEALLKRELDYLKARDVVLQLDVQEKDIRLDGMLRADARPLQPGVKISFESMHGPLTYATDSCELWQHNVRSIAMGLEALRAVDRYGVTHRGEQYTGWKAIGTGPAHAMGTSSHMTRSQAEAVLTRVVGAFDFSEGKERLRRARAMAHPDRHNGDRTLWDQVEQAAKVLGLLS